MKKIDRKYIKNIIAGMIVLCMMLADISLAVSNASQKDFIEVEDHELTMYLADGNYNGTDSDAEITNGDNDSISTYQNVYMFNILEIIPEEGLATVGFSIDGFEPVYDTNIKNLETKLQSLRNKAKEGNLSELEKEELKSLPDEILEMRHAYMDALINEDICGGNSVQPLSMINNVITQFCDTDSSKQPFGYEKNIYNNTKTEHTGYYKYVGSGKGYYAKVNGYSNRFISKFSTKNANHGTFDYIWKGTTQSYQSLINSNIIRDGVDIPVQNHKKLSYVNYNVFFDGFYTGQNKEKVNYNEWKETHRIDLRTKIGNQVDDKDIEWADVIIVTDGTGVDSKSAYALYLRAKKNYNYYNNDNGYNNFWNNKVNRMPFPELEKFSYALQIYDRVAVREDAAFLADVDKGFCSHKYNGSISIDSNMRKLIAMLFMINDGNLAGGSGRTMFMDYLHKYVDEYKAPSQQLTACSNAYNVDVFNNMNEARDDLNLEVDPHYMFNDFPRKNCDGSDSYIWDQYWYYDQNMRNNDRPKTGYHRYDFLEFTDSTGKTHTRSNMTDYVYIDEDTGKFMVDTRLSGNVFFVDYHSDAGNFVHRYTTWNNMYNNLNGSDRWPMDKSGDGCLKYWWFDEWVTDQGWRLPMYYHYYAWAGLRVLTEPGKNTTYKNQSFAESNGRYKGDYLKNAIKERTVKREYTDDSHIAERKETVLRHFYLSLNIVNGDGVNKKNKDNKVMYINDYEVDGRTDLPINFKVRTSEPIAKIELFKDSASDENCIALYTGASTNDIEALNADLTFNKSGGGSPIILYNETVYENTGDADPKPAEEGDHHLHIYTYGIKTETITGELESDGSYKRKIQKDDRGEALITSIPDQITTDMLEKVNTKFILRVSIETPTGEYKSVDDKIYVVKRGFFALD